VFIRG